MAADAHSALDLTKVVALLGAAVVAVPLFRRVGLGSVLGYLAAGLVIGPFGLALFAEPETILHTAELGVVMFLFVIGLEMRPRHLWGLRREIFGLGSVQIVACTAGLWGVAQLLGFPADVALIGAFGFVLTSTAIVMQILSERGDMNVPAGQRIIAILLFEDLLIVPLLALVAVMAPESPNVIGPSRWVGLAVGIGAVVGLIVIGVYVLNPLFRLLAASKAREVMTAAALLVVLGAALAMQVGGLSMAMGAFVAGVLLSESSFRHQIEADIEPFRGILLGLFFLGVGMSLQLDVVADNLWLVIGGTLALMAIKGVAIYFVARYFKADHREALERSVLMAQGGEFAFVLYLAAQNAGVFEKGSPTQAQFTAIVVMSMVLTPLVGLLQKRFMPKSAPAHEERDEPHGLKGSVLLIGWGRFGQVASQALLARNADVTVIDTDVDMIRAVEKFGFKIYYCDGTRLDVLHAAGAHHAAAIIIAIDDRKAANKIVELAKHEFANAKLIVRSYDREHSLELVKLGVEHQVRETFESALVFGKLALEALGVEEEAAAEIVVEIRKRDAARFELELADNWDASMSMILSNVPKPTPFTEPKREAQAINEETAAVVDGATPSAVGANE